MADYYAILKRAVTSLPDSTREQRQAVYDKARNALLKQLQSMNPPLPPSEISKQRVALEEAVRAVERDLMLESEAQAAQPEMTEALPNEGNVAPVPAAAKNDEGRDKAAPDVAIDPAVAPKVEQAPAVVSAKPQPSGEGAVTKPVLESEDRVVRKAGQDVLKNAVRDAEKLGAATNAAVRSAQETADIVGEQRKGDAARIEPTLGDAVVSNAKTYKAAKAPSADVSASKQDGIVGEGQVENESSSRFGLWASLAVAAVVLGGSSYLLYQNRSEFLGQSADGAQQQVESGVNTAETSASAKNDPDKAGDDTNGEMVAKNVRTVTVRPDGAAEGDANSNSEQDAAQGEASSQENGDQASSEQQNAVANEQAAINPQDTKAQAIFYEENGGQDGEGKASAGSSQWELSGEGDDAVVSIKAEVPTRNVSFNIRISKNKDTSLPATHLIEIEIVKHALPVDLTIVEVPGLIMKPTEQSRGQGLLGEAVRIADDLHWIALTAGPKELRYNLELMALRSWIDMPMLFKSGRRAILTMQKGKEGTAVVKEALRQWSKQS